MFMTVRLNRNDFACSRTRDNGLFSAYVLVTVYLVILDNIFSILVFHIWQELSSVTSGCCSSDDNSDDDGLRWVEG